MFKILFGLISIFFSINSYAGEIKKDLNEVLNLSIEPYCDGYNGNLEGLELKQLKSLKLKLNNNRKFVKQTLEIMSSISDDHRNLFYKRKSKKHKAEVIAYYKNNNICKFKAMVRIHGDGLDHYDLYNGTPISSMHVELSNGNIGGITKFKLFLPKAEGGDSEVFNSNLFRHLGFLAPRTVKVELNYLSKNIPYLFQETISKELIEFNKFKEGIVLEPSEGGRFIVFRVDNKNWLTKTNNLLIGSEVLHDINTTLYKSKSYYIKNNQKIDPHLKSVSMYDYNWLSGGQTNFLKYLSQFEALIYATNSNHALSFFDRRFFYDEVLGQYHPIYYDAESYLISGKNKAGDNYNFKKATYYAVTYANSVYDKINNLDLYGFQKDLKEANLHIKKKEVYKILDKVKKNLVLLSMSEKLSYKKSKYKFYDLKHVIPNSAKFVYGGVNENFNICDKEFNNCFERPANKELLKGFLRQRTKQRDLLYVGAKKINKIFNDGTRLHRGLYFWQSKKIIDDIYLKYNGSTEVSLDEFKKKISININDYNDRAIIFSNNDNNDNNEINGWEINVNIADKLKKNRELYIPREKNTNLTGCLTILNLKLKELNIFVNDSICEDGLNIVNSSGNINKIEINNSYSDGVDFDYSNVTIEEVIIKNSGNDCVDFSAGIYFVKKILVSGCKDKAVSIGEKSRVTINNSILENSFAGIVVKDSSVLELGKNKINTDHCILGYRKKQEFYGVVINIKEKLNCKNNTLMQKGSTISYVF